MFTEEQLKNILLKNRQLSIRSDTGTKNPSVAGKPNKYRNTKIIIDGRKFDSKNEGNRYLELKLLEKANLIYNLELQRKFVVKEKTPASRQIVYICDFYYFDREKNCWIVEDFKSKATEKLATYRMKRKMLKDLLLKPEYVKHVFKETIG